MLNSNAQFPLKLTWEITEQCNLNCKICYSLNEKSDYKHEYNFQECLLALDRLLSLGVLYIFIDGGEPLLKNRFFDILNICTSKFCTMISTNGTLIGKDEAKRISAANVNNVFVSLHSHVPDKHDTYTKVNGSFNESIKGIEKLIDNGVRTMTSIILHKDNCNDIKDYILLCKELKISKINILRGYPFGKNADEGKSLLLTAEDYADLIPYIEECCKAQDIKLGHSFGLNNHCCCDQAISLTAYGALKNCPYLRNQDELGSFIKDDPIKLWNKKESLQIRNSQKKSENECKKCSIFEMCRGGCPANKMLKNGSMAGKDPLCWL